MWSLKKETRPKGQVHSEEVKVPAVRVCLLQSVNVPSGRSSLVPVCVEGTSYPGETLLLEYDPGVEAITGLRVDDSLLQPNEDGVAHVQVSNISRFVSSIKQGT